MNIYITYNVAADFLNVPFLYGVSYVAKLFCLLFSILLWHNEADRPAVVSARILHYLILPSFSISARPVDL